MTTLPIVGLLLAVADAATHWPPFRWVGYALSVVGQVLAAAAWLKARHAPPAVIYACPNRCGFLGDATGVDAHAAGCVQRWAA